MVVYIKEWPNRTATIMSASGQVIWTFSNTAAARQACSDWHNLVDSEPVVLCEDVATGVPDTTSMSVESSALTRAQNAARFGIASE